MYHLGNCHIYDDHVDSLKEQIKREPYSFPKVEISKVYENVNDYTLDDFIVSDYEFHNTIKMKMRV